MPSTSTKLPPNPQVKVSPWLQSTIEPDTNRKPMEIGGQ